MLAARENSLTGSILRQQMQRSFDSV